MSNFDFKFKLLILGEAAVGKTSILQRYVEDDFNISHLQTVGIDFKQKIVSVENKTIRLIIWDTAGQERFRNLAPSYFRGTEGIILVYDVTNTESFRQVYYWIKQIRSNDSENKISLILVGNKSDLVHKRQITKEQGEELAAHLKLKFVETSAKNGDGINEAFDELVEEMMKRHEEGGERGVLLSKESNNLKKKCC